MYTMSTCIFYLYIHIPYVYICIYTVYKRLNPCLFWVFSQLFIATHTQTNSQTLLAWCISWNVFVRLTVIFIRNDSINLEQWQYFPKTKSHFFRPRTCRNTNETEPNKSTLMRAGPYYVLANVPISATLCVHSTCISV